MIARFSKYQLIFKQPAGTSRGVLHTKDTYFIQIKDNVNIGTGEAALFRGLSADDVPDYEEKLKWAVDHINLPKNELFNELKNYSSIIFGLEQAFDSLNAKINYIPYPSDFTRGINNISINGLVWMGEKRFMKKQIIDKINQGFSVIKLKIGAIDFQDEIDLLRFIRSEFSSSDIEIRVDANGAFSIDTALEKIKRLSDYQLHSIEQPIKQGQIDEMAKLCQKTPLSIALDEELIGYNYQVDKIDLLSKIMPQYIILKPALHGGFIGTKSWIKASEKLGVKWWITSALESNIGLNNIAQFTYNQKVTIPQGLGTGGLFINNFSSPLSVIKGALHFDPNKKFKLISF